MKRSYDNIEPRGGGGRTRGRSYGGPGRGMFFVVVVFLHELLLILTLVGSIDDNTDISIMYVVILNVFFI